MVIKRLPQFKYCCNGQHARLTIGLYPMTRTTIDGRRVRFYTAIYKCLRCKSLTLRGETDNLNTSQSVFVESVTEERVQELLERKEQYELAK